MNKKQLAIAALLMVLILLTPSFVKLEHHHKIKKCHAKNVKHFHNQKATCLICSFEFSLFSINKLPDVAVNYNYAETLINGYKNSYFSNNSKFSFLLRAPPAS